MVRLANYDDLERVNEIRRQVNDVHYNGRPDIFRPGFCKEMQNIIYEVWEDNNSDVIVSVRDNVICGFATLDYVTKSSSPYSYERHYCNVREFGVDEKFRRKGIATEMFEFIKEHAQNKGFDRIELDIWEFNEAALKFYESVGFKTYRRYMEYDI